MTKPAEGSGLGAVAGGVLGGLEARGHLGRIDVDDDGIDLLVDHVLDAADHGGDIAGFVITLPPGAEYDSSRYRWFEDELADAYVYLDRIVVSDDHRRKGVASSLYEEVEGDLPIALEVYETNDVSLAFHESRGFEEVGALTDEGKTNLMLVREPEADESAA